MKILFITSAVKNLNAGSAGADDSLIKALRSLGHEVDEVWGERLGRRIKHGNLHYLLELPFTYNHFITKMCKKKRYDVIDVNQPHAYFAAIVNRILKRTSVFIIRSHGLEPRISQELKYWQKRYKQENRISLHLLLSSLLGKLLNLNYILAAKHCDGYVVLNTSDKSFLIDKYKLSEQRIFVRPNGIPDNFISKEVKYFSRNRSTKILFIGDFEFRKAPFIVAEVINKLLDLNEDLRFTWICASKFHESIKKLLSQKSIDKTLFLGSVQRDKLLDIYDDHGILLFPSFAEGFGLVVQEAMSRGLCIVAADNSGVHDFINSGINGILVPTGNVEEMVIACRKVIDDYNMAIKMSEEAIKTSRKNKWEKIAQETVLFYEKRLAAKALDRINK